MKHRIFDYGRRCGGGRQDGYVLDEIVQLRRNAKAVRRLLKRLLHKQGRRPRHRVTDKLGSYAAARRKIMRASSIDRIRV